MKTRLNVQLRGLGRKRRSRLCRKQTGLEAEQRHFLDCQILFCTVDPGLDAQSSHCRVWEHPQPKGTAMAFSIPDDYGYVVLAHCMSWVSNMYLTINVVQTSACSITLMLSAAREVPLTIFLRPRC